MHAENDYPLWFDETMAELIAWFENATLPEQPFQLSPWEKITNPSGYYDALRRDITAGPTGPRARFDAVKSDLQRLKAFCESS